MDHQAIRSASLKVADALNELESLVLSQPESEERRSLLRAAQRLASLVDVELNLPLEQAIEKAEETTAKAKEGSEGSARGLDIQLSQSDVDQIDAHLREACTDQWRQAARIAGTAVAHWPELPVSIFAERLQHLCRMGHLESRGDLTQVLHSEVRRLPSAQIG